jgi:glucose-1-phosphate adenylyltransferase
MGVYIFNTRALMDALRVDAQESTSHHDFGKNIIPQLIEGQRVSVYDYTKAGTRLGTYWRDVGTVEAYYSASMETLMSSLFDSYANAGWPLYGVDESGQTGRRMKRRAAAFVRNAAISPGVSVSRGSVLLDSLLAAGVRIGRSAAVRNSILLNHVRIGAGARIRHAILDDNVRIADFAEVGYDPEVDRRYGFVTQNGIVVIPANTYVGPSSEAAAPLHGKWRTEAVKRRQRRQAEPSQFDVSVPTTHSCEIDKE